MQSFGTKGSRKGSTPSNFWVSLASKGKDSSIADMSGPPPIMNWGNLPATPKLKKSILIRELIQPMHVILKKQPLSTMFPYLNSLKEQKFRLRK